MKLLQVALIVCYTAELSTAERPTVDRGLQEKGNKPDRPSKSAEVVPAASNATRSQDEQSLEMNVKGTLQRPHASHLERGNASKVQEVQAHQGHYDNYVNALMQMDAKRDQQRSPPPQIVQKTIKNSLLEHDNIEEEEERALLSYRQSRERFGTVPVTQHKRVAEAAKMLPEDAGWTQYPVPGAKEGEFNTHFKGVWTRLQEEDKKRAEMDLPDFVNTAEMAMEESDKYNKELDAYIDALNDLTNSMGALYKTIINEHTKTSKEMEDAVKSS